MPVSFGFVAGTTVQTPSGARPIEGLAVGELVWAWDLDHARAVAAPIVGLHTELVDHLDEVVGEAGRIAGCAPGTGIYDVFEEMFRAAASLSTLSELLLWREGQPGSDPVLEVPEHLTPSARIYHLTLGADQTCFFADDALVRHLAEA
jgi:hypothetical protein